MKLRYTPEALRDLQEIKRYIKSELHNPTAANRITKAILDGCAQLKQFPEMGVSIGAKTSYETDLRMLVVESYIALYRIVTAPSVPYWTGGAAFHQIAPMALKISFAKAIMSPPKRQRKPCVRWLAS